MSLKKILFVSLLTVLSFQNCQKFDANQLIDISSVSPAGERVSLKSAYINQDTGEIMIGDDLVLGHKSQLDESGQFETYLPSLHYNNRSNSKAQQSLFKRSLLWEKEVPYTFIPSHNYSEQQRQAVRNAIAYFNTLLKVHKVNIQLRPFRTGDRKYISFGKSSRDYSYVDYLGAPRNGVSRPIYIRAPRTVEEEQQGFIGDFTTNIIVHEIMHALGFAHEHQRSDRNQYIQVLDNNIHPSSRSQYLLADTINHTPYDYHSTMHYGDQLFRRSPDSGATMRLIDGSSLRDLRNTQRVILTSNDIKKLKIVYGETSESLDFRLVNSLVYRYGPLNRQYHKKELQGAPIEKPFIFLGNGQLFFQTSLNYCKFGVNSTADLNNAGESLKNMGLTRTHSSHSTLQELLNKKFVSQRISSCQDLLDSFYTNSSTVRPWGEVHINEFIIQSRQFQQQNTTDLINNTVYQYDGRQFLFSSNRFCLYERNDNNVLSNNNFDNQNSSDPRLVDVRKLAQAAYNDQNNCTSSSTNDRQEISRRNKQPQLSVNEPISDNTPTRTQENFNIIQAGQDYLYDGRHFYINGENSCLYKDSEREILASHRIDSLSSNDPKRIAIQQLVQTIYQQNKICGENNYSIDKQVTANVSNRELFINGQNYQFDGRHFKFLKDKTCVYANSERQISSEFNLDLSQDLSSQFSKYAQFAYNLNDLCQ